VTNITLRLRSKLAEDGLSSVLTAAGFSVLSELDRQDVIVIRDLDDHGEPLALNADRQRDIKTVVLASEAESLAMSPRQIAQLSGVLTYSLSADAFVRSLRLICSGERIFPRDLASGRVPPAPPAGAEPRAGDVRLSPREKEVLSVLLQGHSNKVIAHHLGTTEATVKVHLKNLMHKTKVDNRTQAAIWALANLPKLEMPRGSVRAMPAFAGA
jgi:two-component system, NarL family, nitrate/nitrite response regulator NarL